MREPLPIDSFIDGIVDTLRGSRALIVTAAPGAGKTTRLPPALAADGPVILLQPRRVAARAIARRIAEECEWTLGGEIGWQIRFERRFGDRTRLLVATEGVLTARLQHDPLLSDFRTIVLDEFHERSIHADLAIAFSKQAWLARDDLRIVVMSATMDTAAVSAFFGGCPVIEVPGRLHPIEIAHEPGRTVVDAALGLLNAGAPSSGNVLCFLPGAFEIRRAAERLEQAVSRDFDVLPLYGSLDASAQELALRPMTPSSRRRIIVATNVAETSVTVPGVTAVIDSGLQKVARFDADRGIDSLDVERITADSADQRAGRAGRTAPGVVKRLWDPRDRLRAHREPDVQRIDLSGVVLDILAWGGDPGGFEWFERPSRVAVESAVALLERLGAVSGGRLTGIGRAMHRLSLHPRLSRMIVAAEGAREMLDACVLLSERHLVPARTASTSSDLLSAIDAWQTVPAHVQRLARDTAAMLSAAGFSRTKRLSDSEFRRAVLAGYPDRVGQRREAGLPRVRLASGTGAVLSAESGVSEGEFLVAIDVQAGRAGEPDARIRIASRVERDWLQPTDTEIAHRFDPDSGTVRATCVERYDALVLAERPTRPDAGLSRQLLAEAWMARGPSDDDERLLRRLRFAGRAVEFRDLVEAAIDGVRSLPEARLERGVPGEVLRDLDRTAPESLRVPSGRFVRLEYGADGTISAAVKLQELFGMAETPRVGRQQEPVLLSLLAPNGRPVQVTRDLRSFWNRTYPEVRKELRGRYPKHPWPDDPWTAPPTARAKRSPRA